MCGGARNAFLSLDLGTAAAARNVLLSITGCLQLLYRRNTCLAPDRNCVRHCMLHMITLCSAPDSESHQLMGSGHDAAGGLAVEIGAGGDDPIGSSIRVHRERCKGSRRALIPVRPMAAGETCFSTALRRPIRSTLDDQDHADVPE
jgi:hypothetical protein